MIQNAESAIDTLIRYMFQIGYVCAFELQVCREALQILIPNSISNFSSKFLLENVTRSLTSVDN